MADTIRGTELLFAENAGRIVGRVDNDQSGLGPIAARSLTDQDQSWGVSV